MERRLRHLLLWNTRCDPTRDAGSKLRYCRPCTSQPDCPCMSRPHCAAPVAPLAPATAPLMASIQLPPPPVYGPVRRHDAAILIIAVLILDRSALLCRVWLKLFVSSGRGRPVRACKSLACKQASLDVWSWELDATEDVPDVVFNCNSEGFGVWAIEVGAYVNVDVYAIHSSESPWLNPDNPSVGPN